MQALRPQFLPAAIAGLLVAGLLGYLPRAAPAELRTLGEQLQIPLTTKLLYGGITEEILMRWGLMTTLIWLPWRFIQGREGLPRNVYVAAGVLLAALVFALGHLPVVVAMGAELSPHVVLYIMASNTLPGILFGFLYWRWGLEAAILAHALSHAASTLVL